MREKLENNIMRLGVHEPGHNLGLVSPVFLCGGDWARDADGNYILDEKNRRTLDEGSLHNPIEINSDFYFMTQGDEEVSSTYRTNARSWWDPNRDNGILMEHFTNVLQAVRIDRNWTNYFHLVRDGMYKDSIRVKEDSFYDLRNLIFYATTNQAHLIYNDPLVSPEHKAYLLEQHPYVNE